MEFIRGHTILEIVRAVSQTQTPLSIHSTIRIGAAVAAALEYIHGLCDVDGKPLNIVHRDVTPQNIMVSAAGTVKLIDFGIVRSSVQTHVTQNGIVKGKFAYLAPETIETRGKIDQRADLFSLGICLYEMLTGRPLFRGSTDPQTLDRLRHMPIPSLLDMRSDVPPELSAVIMRALERRPDRRFQTATEFLSALDAVAEECSIVHSLTRLRDEIVSLCGPAPLPTADFETMPELEQPAERREPHSEPAQSVAKDVRLAYFVARANLATPSQPNLVAPPEADPAAALVQVD
jgi:serine/threonine-protein kinase